MKIFVGMPVSSSQANVSAVGSFLGATEQKCTNAVSKITLLAANHNQLLCLARNYGADVLAILHSDVSVNKGWVDVLIEEMEKHQASVVSQVVPIKCDELKTSTAITDTYDDWNPEPLTYEDLQTLPDTFDANDAGCKILLVNTGCMAIRLADIDQVDEEGIAKVYFTINDRLRCIDGEWTRDVEPEDWFFSKRCNQVGAKVMATQRLTVQHHGEMSWKFEGRG